MFKSTPQLQFGNPIAVTTLQERMIPGEARNLTRILRSIKGKDEFDNTVSLSGLTPLVRRMDFHLDSNNPTEVTNTWYVIYPELPHTGSPCLFVKRDGIMWRASSFTYGRTISDQKFKLLQDLAAAIPTDFAGCHSPLEDI